MMDAEAVGAITGDLVGALYDSKSQRALVAEQLLARQDVPAAARRLARQILDSAGKPDEIAVRTQTIHQLLALFDPVNYAPGWDGDE